MDKTLRILILEDNQSDAELIQYELRKAGFNFTACLTSNKTEFMAALDAFHPDLLLVDYSLPGFDGITAMTLARRRFEDIPVILVSGAIGEETAIEALKAGATDYVLKQRLLRLVPVVRRALQEAEQLAERKRAEDALRQLSHFPEEDPNPVLRCSLGGDVLYANTPARLWLETLEEQAGEDNPLREAVAEVHRQGHGVVKTEITNSAGRTFDITCVQPQGETYVNLYFSDLTDHKRAKEALERSNRELEQFAAVASHDLQEPLRAIVGFLQLLQRRYEDKLDEKGLHFIERAVKASHRMQSLINDLLTLSRVHIKGADPVVTNLNQLVEGVMDNLQSIIQEKNVEITCGRLPRLKVDAGQIRSLFQNLIMNAVRYNENPKPLIDIGFHEHGNAYHFYVKDNGIGISPQFYQRIFLIFQRLHTAGEHPGTGLGLALCKKIVERHGGTIWVESKLREGSTFYFSLPISS